MKDIFGASFGVCAKREELSIKAHAGLFYVRINGVLYARADTESKARAYADGIMKGYEIGRESTKTTGAPKY